MFFWRQKVLSKAIYRVENGIILFKFNNLAQPEHIIKEAYDV